MNAKPISESANPGCWAIGFIALFGSMFLFIGLALLVTQVAMPWLSTKDAADWPQVPCNILSSEIEEHRGDTTTYSVEIEYEYTVANQTHRSSQYDFSTQNRSREACREIIASYPVGQQSTCYIDPNDPDDAVLALTALIAWPVLVAGGIFSAVGAIIAIVVPFGLVRKSKSVQTVGVSGYDADGSVHHSMDGQAYSQVLFPEDLEDKKWDKPQRLKPSATKIGSLVGMVLLAMFWNGIVVTISLSFFNRAPNGIFSIFLGLFLIPFVLIGLLIILGAGRAFLALFSPDVEIALSTGAIARGADVDVAWEVKGNAERIHRLQIAAVGTEIAQYRQGTDTRTETSDFELITILDSTESEGISFGSAAIKIPEGTMHTFAGSNNKVTWAIQVRGSINRWPDVIQTHAFRVKP